MAAATTAGRTTACRRRRPPRWAWRMGAGAAVVVVATAAAVAAAAAVARRCGIPPSVRAARRSAPAGRRRRPSTSTTRRCFGFRCSARGCSSGCYRRRWPPSRCPSPPSARRSPKCWKCTALPTACRRPSRSTCRRSSPNSRSTGCSCPLPASMASPPGSSLPTLSRRTSTR
ncbi:hypothetical protein BU14_2414s0001 [Porphyra umbilicalis]|uniref:Uncharacterized protein n=1 Tax=Porphyra umbilicalis TaxID=2786 RepID=A0A1X6NJ75_PORUM|nr:hypothetical protein BU14_2414s0001 [Porphyra umbilicalis]|eukprot:OSX68665.1 hypothetical protein BU14_2414s0001 [Porphyra umbilicalis]